MAFNCSGVARVSLTLIQFDAVKLSFSHHQNAMRCCPQNRRNPKVCTHKRDEARSPCQSNGQLLDNSRAIRRLKCRKPYGLVDELKLEAGTTELEVRRHPRLKLIST